MHPKASKENKLQRDTMKPKLEEDPTTGVVKQPLIYIILGGWIVFAVLVWVSVIIPYYSIYFLYVTLPAGILGYLSLIWLNSRPNLYARFFINIGIAIPCAVISFRIFDDLLPGFSIICAALIAAIIVFAHVLPIQSPSLANLIRRELFAPKTKRGKLFFRVSLLAVFAIMFLSIPVGLITNKDPRIFALSFLALLMAIIMPYSYRAPSSPWENQSKHIPQHQKKH